MQRHGDSQVVDAGDDSIVYQRLDVKHGLDDRTLIVVLILATIIGINGVVMGMNLANQSMQAQYTRDLAVKYQVNTNHVGEVEKDLAVLKETTRANQ